MADQPPPSGRRGRKRGNGEGTIAKRSDGRYAAAIHVTRPDGTRGRKWIYGRTRSDVAGKLAALAQRVAAGAVIPTRSPTLYGLRRGEIAALRWDDVDFTDKRITVDAHRSAGDVTIAFDGEQRGGSPAQVVEHDARSSWSAPRSSTSASLRA